MSLSRDEHKKLVDRFAGKRIIVLGDLMMAAVLRLPPQTELVAGFPNLDAFVKRGEARPAFRRALEDQLAAFREHEPQGVAA